MGDRLTDTYPPYEPEEAYEWDYADERQRPGGKVLWGRVVILAVGLFVAFWLGRTTAPEGIPASRVSALQDDIQELQDENEELQAVLAQPTTEPTDAATPAEEEEEPVEPGESYIVEKGDTLRGIAQTFCGDPQFDDLIAEANDIDDPTNLPVGTELTIPADCGE